VKGCACQPQTVPHSWTQAEVAPQKPDAGEALGQAGNVKIQPAIPSAEPLPIVRSPPFGRFVPQPSQSTFGRTPVRSPVAPKQGSPGAFFR
jgi:hypothetical protein